MQACKPGFVGYFHNRLIIYLFSVSQPESISLPNHTSLHSQRVTDHLREYDLFGLSTRKVCHAHIITAVPVGSYPTFSLSPPKAAATSGYLFSVALSVATPRRGTFPLGSTELYVARTFLLCTRQKR